MNEPPLQHVDHKLWVPGFALGPYHQPMASYIPADDLDKVQKLFSIIDDTAAAPETAAPEAPASAATSEQPYMVLSVFYKNEWTTCWQKDSNTGAWNWHVRPGDEA